MKDISIQFATLFALAFVQNVSFSIVSRSRNRDNMTFHLIAAVFSNGLWYLTMNQLVEHSMKGLLAIPYCTGTVMGSVCGMKISMWIEKKLGITSDSHVKPIAIIKNEKS